MFSKSNVISEVCLSTSGTFHTSTDAVQRSDVELKTASLAEDFEAELTRQTLQQQHGKNWLLV